MLPFAVRLKPGESPYRQIVYAATKPWCPASCRQAPRFPSVRELSQALKINPNTAQKVIAELVRDGLLEVHPGVGTVVTAARRATAGERRALLSDELEQLLVEAKRLGLKKNDVLNAVSDSWSELFGDDRDGTR
jgi:GntR family transcriptional regulator